MIIFNNKLKKFVYKDGIESKKSTTLKKGYSLVPFLSETLKIEDGVKFGDFFNNVIENWPEYEHVFSSVLNGYSLEPFYKEWKRPSKPNKFASGMTHIEVYWDSNEINLDDTNEEIYSGPGFHGYGTWQNADGSVNEEGGFALEFSPINELKKYPFKLINLFTLYTYKEGKLIDKLIEFRREFTVYDVLSAIFYEISFMGSPEYRDESFENLKQSAEELKTKIDNDPDSLNPNDVKFDANGNLLIGNSSIRDWVNKSMSDMDKTEDDTKQKGTTNLYDILKKYKIDRSKP